MIVHGISSQHRCILLKRFWRKKNPEIFMPRQPNSKVLPLWQYHCVILFSILCGNKAIFLLFTPFILFSIFIAFFCYLKLNLLFAYFDRVIKFSDKNKKITNSNSKYRMFSPRNFLFHLLIFLLNKFFPLNRGENFFLFSFSLSCDLCE